MFIYNKKKTLLLTVQNKIKRLKIYKKLLIHQSIHILTCSIGITHYPPRELDKKRKIVRNKLCFINTQLGAIPRLPY